LIPMRTVIRKRSARGRWVTGLAAAERGFAILYLPVI
jgi:hypothetical protein